MPNFVQGGKADGESVMLTREVPRVVNINRTKLLLLLPSAPQTLNGSKRDDEPIDVMMCPTNRHNLNTSCPTQPPLDTILYKENGLLDTVGNMEKGR